MGATETKRLIMLKIPKTSKIEFRLSMRDKTLIKNAANNKGLTISDYVREAIIKELED